MDKKDLGSIPHGFVHKFEHQLDFFLNMGHIRPLFRYIFLFFEWKCTNIVGDRI